jgi:hypothetical protein
MKKQKKQKVQKIQKVQQLHRFVLSEASLDFSRRQLAFEKDCDEDLEVPIVDGVYAY